MGRVLLMMFLGVLLLTGAAGSFAVSLFSNPVDTFNSMPLWFWGVGVWVFLGSIYTSVVD